MITPEEGAMIYAAGLMYSLQSTDPVIRFYVDTYEHEASDQHRLAYHRGSCLWSIEDENRLDVHTGGSLVEYLARVKLTGRLI